MDVAHALRILGLEGSPSWESVRAAHRAAIRTVHPDAGGDAASAARVNEAYDVLRRIVAAQEPPGVTEKRSFQVVHDPGYLFGEAGVHFNSRWSACMLVPSL